MLQLLIKLFGRDYVNRAIGTRTNVSKPIQLDQNSPFKLYSDEAYNNPKARQLIEDKIAEYGPFALSNKNASEVANFEMNARRLLEAKNKEFGVTEGLLIRSDLMKMTDDKLNALAKEGESLQAKRVLTGEDRERLKYINNILEEAQKLPNTGKGLREDIKAAGVKPEADVIDIETKKKVDEKGLGSLRDDFGLPQGVDPKSERGKLIQELQRSTAGSKKAEELAKNILDDMLGPFGGTKDLMREGQRRAVVRQIMLKDKRIGLTDKELEDLRLSKDLQRGTDAKDPLELFDKYYTRNNTKFDALDGIIDGSRSPNEAAEQFMKEFDGFDIVAPAKPKPMTKQEELDEAERMRNKFRFDDEEVDELDEFLDDTPRDDKAKGGLADILGV